MNTDVQQQRPSPEFVPATFFLDMAHRGMEMLGEWQRAALDAAIRQSAAMNDAVKEQSAALAESARLWADSVIRMQRMMLDVAGCQMEAASGMVKEPPARGRALRVEDRSEAPDWSHLQAKWKQYKGKVRERWGRLTDEDLGAVQGKREELIAKIQERYGLAAEEAERQLNDFVRQTFEAGERVRTAGSF